MKDKQGNDLQIDLINLSIQSDSFEMAAASRSDQPLDSGTPHADKAMEMGQASKQSEQLLQLLKTPESEKATKNIKCNLRKSLAWDSAFFTNAGVLDVEELSTIIQGSEKGVKNLLPGIQEDVHASMDSISTLESDSLTFESLEAELFEDIRASIQKSSRTSNMATLSSNAPGGTNPQAKAISVSKKMDLTAANKPTPKSGGKLQNASMTGSGKMINQSRNNPQVTQPVTRIKESTSSVLRPTKSISKVNPLPSVAAKRASQSANHFKLENANSTSVSLKGTQASKSTTLGGPRRGLPKSSSSSLASSTASKTESTRSSSSHGSSGSSSHNIGKSAASSAKINYSKLNSSGPIPKTPSNSATRSKISAPTSGLSTPMISSNISPASSISEWSVDSSSSSSTMNQKSTSRASIDANSSCRSSNGDLDVNLHFADKMSDRNRNQKAELSGQNFKKATAQASSISRPDSMKPSGLRMPSPKIGFFDGSKSVRSPNSGQSQTRLSTGFPKKVLKVSTNLKPASPVLSKEISTPLAKAITTSKNSIDVQVGWATELGERSCSDSCVPEQCSEKNLNEVKKEEIAANLRTPLTEMNSLQNSEGFDNLTEPGIKAVEMTVNLVSSEIAQKENV